MIKNYQPALRQDLIEKGFSLEGESDQFVYLYINGQRVAAFSQQTTLAEIHKEADEWWNKHVN